MVVDLGFATQHHLEAADGRRICAWYTRGRETVPRGILVLVPGFGQRMHHASAFSQYLALNGFDVVRYDSLDHPGLSDGDISNFTMSAGQAGLMAVLQWVASNHAPKHLGVLATSLGVPIAVRALQRVESARFFVSISGVVDLEKTLTHVCGHNYAAAAISSVPETVRIQSHEVNARRFYVDGHSAEWFDSKHIAECFARLPIPVTAFIGQSDEWVDIHDVAEVMRAKSQDVRSVITLEGTGHDVGKNAAMARNVMRRAVSECLSLVGAGDTQVQEPEFAALMECALNERRAQRRSTPVSIAKQLEGA